MRQLRSLKEDNVKLTEAANELQRDFSIVKMKASTSMQQLDGANERATTAEDHLRDMQPEMHALEDEVAELQKKLAEAGNADDIEALRRRLEAAEGNIALANEERDEAVGENEAIEGSYSMA